jgi:hypothetical protein
VNHPSNKQFFLSQSWLDGITIGRIMGEDLLKVQFVPVDALLGAVLEYQLRTEVEQLAHFFHIQCDLHTAWCNTILNITAEFLGRIMKLELNSQFLLTINVPDLLDIDKDQDRDTRIRLQKITTPDLARIRIRTLFAMLPIGNTIILNLSLGKKKLFLLHFWGVPGIC